MKSLENKFPPPLVTLVIGAAMWGVARRQHPISIEPYLHHALIVLTASFGLVVGPAGIWEFRRRRTTIDPVRIDNASLVVTTGVYRLTRNPMYVGLTALLTTWAVWLAVPLTLLGPLVFAWFTHRFQILPEERAMGARFGREYDDYRARVRRWL